MDWLKLLGIALLAASPVGEELVAIPVGVGLGLPAPVVAVVCLVANYIPAVAISLLVKYNENSRFLRWIHKLRRERIQRWLERWGFWGVVLLAPWAGVYAAVIAMEGFGMPRARLHTAVILSLSMYAAIATSLTVAGFDFFRR